MKDIPENIKDIVKSELRVVIFDIIHSLNEPFSLQDIMDELEKKDIIVKPNAIQHFLSALTFRQFLTASNQVEKKKFGRAKLQYCIAKARAEFGG